MKSEFDHFTHLDFGKTISKLEKVYPTSTWSCFSNEEIMNLMSLEDVKRFKDFVTNEFFLHEVMEERFLKLVSFAREFLERVLESEVIRLDSIKY